MNTCVILQVNLTYSDGHIRWHLGILAALVLKFSLTVMMLHNG